MYVYVVHVTPTPTHTHTYTLNNSSLIVVYAQLRIANAVVNEENASMQTMDTSAVVDLVESSAQKSALGERRGVLHHSRTHEYLHHHYSQIFFIRVELISTCSVFDPSISSDTESHQYLPDRATHQYLLDDRSPRQYLPNHDEIFVSFSRTCQEEVEAKQWRSSAASCRCEGLLLSLVLWWLPHRSLHSNLPP